MKYQDLIFQEVIVQSIELIVMTLGIFIHIAINYTLKLKSLC